MRALSRFQFSPTIINAAAPAQFNTQQKSIVIDRWIDYRQIYSNWRSIINSHRCDVVNKTIIYRRTRALRPSITWRDKVMLSSYYNTQISVRRWHDNAADSTRCLETTPNHTKTQNLNNLNHCIVYYCYFFAMGGRLRWALCLSGNPPLCFVAVIECYIYFVVLWKINLPSFWSSWALWVISVMSNIVTAAVLDIFHVKK